MSRGAMRDTAKFLIGSSRKPTFVIALHELRPLAPVGNQEAVMLSEGFDEATRSRMDYALELACRGLPEDRQGHEWRKIVAEDVMRCAHEGRTSLEDLTAAARHCVVEKLGGKAIRSVPFETVAV